MRLPDSQLAVLDAANTTDEPTVDRLADETGLKSASVTGAAFDLRDEGLVSVEETTDTDAELTDEAHEYLDDGLPEIRLYRAAIDAGADDEPVSMGQLIGASGLGGPQVDIALSNFARKGYGVIDSGDVTADPDADPDVDPEQAALESLAAGDSVDDTDLLDQLERRELIVQSERTVRTIQPTDEGTAALEAGIEVAETVDALTPEMLTSGEWEDVEFTEYNVEADAPRVEGGRKHILRQTSDRVKDVLVGMGFKEMDGPHADADFWINDCLFMPQDHPARTHWDRFALDVPGIQDLPDQLVDRVESAHRNGVGDDGEGYHSPWSRDFAEAVALRGHTTSLSMRYLSGFAGADIDPPQRYFSVEKVYRNDTLDPTHLLEFFQIEGWVMAEDLSVRDLMGTFEEFYKQFGITDIQFKPHYNPYTEPSFELFGTHPTTGELVEIGNSGMFRPEVLEPLGIECDVMAWGLALERLLMLMYGFEDIRDVHGTLCDLELLRETEVVY
ncbi:phenylalanyl-tRNA synthetase alpha subunit [Halohasta litchfieldiae]|jgi:phenylalanyl-tRNA synthetase alpha chain|uniref:Phenylalanine--tRNA ligase alpha subunit n=1 Tax=Halohasta litchfieldiae TaxID=1073996 RepID=A0A1H6TY73_9EURY|nr:phenylalanine--tRNA ligase subunit alpha [Halohasta litchfieldiae]ATW88920.1 phenylalanyl-tRNA synthetase alpha subunit [Halohasta litchfieldiae]SEI81210.1 phenylalanyl-tRNA synthetase, alpha subunit [Halohasta litchfieldiae]